MRFYNITSKKVLLFVVFIFLLQSNLQAQNFQLHHRKYNFSKENIGLTVPWFCIEIGKPTFSSAGKITTPSFKFSLFNWEPENNKEEVIRGLESKIVTLSSDTSEVVFDWRFYCVDMDSLLNQDSTLVVQYFIVDSVTNNLISMALETNVLNSFSFYDSSTGKISTEYEILGYRAHSFKSYPGQKVYTKVQINWSSLKDSYTAEFSISDAYGSFVDSSAYLASPWRQNALSLCNSTPTNINLDNVQYPEGLLLHQNYPNPFNGKTIIPFFLFSPEYVLIEIYNLRGQKVLVIPNRRYSTGLNKVVIDSNNLSSGLYLYSVKTTTYSQVRKFIVLK